ncbi:OB-fold protein [Polaribacter porphyrae]|uniref:tRNA_anti-like n=1 Tax=Polaribacter porphyrae TaxID=1137780 RepID=A0A2S7WLN7_9FLAO|nr:hypothetical protein [Polaribacter porphyrae]PQJ78366.1 hypothetical protein BTO18_03795 [Polaribacter porphyrae]
MKLKNKFFLLIVFVLILINTYHYIIPLFVDSSEKNLKNETVAFTIHSNDLLRAYSKNEEKTDTIYTNKIIEVIGTVKEISFLNSRNTVILQSNSNTFGVICDVNSAEKEKIKTLKENQKIIVKGLCKGFLKDVILLNCSIEIL